ncbi:MAG: response regulator [Gammaproteobacteria bacterium]|nr:response regulator [Gammaproteobacteria bacterium]MDP2141354.1 response regulator [Gammaproteobacteria bacterium]MDP2349059.1 response regulator [Gammaproteobacteria bacterium]
MLPSDNPAQIRVMLVDDHELVRCGLARIIDDEPDMEVVSLAESGEDAIEKLASVIPDVILMDVKMSGIGGVDATQRIMRAYPGMRVIAISALEVGLIPTRMLRAGAVGFITKCVSVQEMLLAIRLVHSGERFITQRIATRLALNPFDLEAQKTPFGALSERELQVALMLIDCHKINKISDQLHLSPKTVYSYRYRIFEKLGLSSDVELTILAVKHGLSDADTSRITYE